MKQVFINLTYLLTSKQYLFKYFFIDAIDRSNDTYTNITSLPELSNYMTSNIVLISGASLAGCVIILSFGMF